MPQTVITAPFLRTLSAASAGQLPAEVPQINVQPTTDGGFYCCPLWLPPDVDVSRSIEVTARATIGSALPVTGGDVLYRLGIGFSVTPLDWGVITFDVIWPVDPVWEQEDTIAIPLDNGSGWAIDGGVLEPGAVLCLSLSRLGSDVLDTYIRFLFLTPSLQLKYYRRCQAVCC